MSTTVRPLRPIDHVVLPVTTLDVARERFQSLGFNVADDARHNFGTENANIGFSNGTFIEPLAIGHRETVDEHILKGNQFLIRDAAYRFRHGDTGLDGGFSCAVFSGENAKKDRKRLRKQGYRTGKIAKVKRPGLDIRATFAMDERAPLCTLFICERPEGLPIFSNEITNHPNGALRISRMTFVDDNPSDFQYYLQDATNQRDIDSHSFGMNMQLENGEISALSPAGLKMHYGCELADTKYRDGLRLVACDIAVSSLAETGMLLAQREIDARQIGNRIIVQSAPGQGAILAFVEEGGL